MRAWLYESAGRRGRPRKAKQGVEVLLDGSAELREQSIVYRPTVRRPPFRCVCRASQIGAGSWLSKTRGSLSDRARGG
jgi:hypothetical protein